MSENESLLRTSNIEFAKLLEKVVYILTLKVRMERNFHKGKIALKRAKSTVQKCEEIIKKLEKVNDIESFIQIQAKHRKWLNTKSKEWELELNFPQPDKAIWKNMSSKELRKQQTYNYTAKVLAKLGAEDITAGTGMVGYPIIFNSNLEKVTQGENIELSLSLRGNNREFYTEASSTQGIIKPDRHNSFQLNIPTKELGIQNFKLAVSVRNFIEEIDTTLYIEETFEVIK